MPRQTRPQMVVMSFRLPADVRDLLYAKAEREGRNPTEVVRDLVSAWTEDDEGPTPDSPEQASAPAGPHRSGEG